jgi:hypothetical protein
MAISEFQHRLLRSADGLRDDDSRPKQPVPHLAALPALMGILTIFLNLIIALHALAQPGQETSGLGTATPRSDEVAVSQMGWAPDAPKHAVLSVRQALPEAPSFRVTQGTREVLSGTAKPASPRWGLFFYVADISAVDASGEYEVQIGDGASARFEIRPDVYTSVRGVETNGSRPLHGLRQILGGFLGRQRSSTDRSAPGRHADESALSIRRRASEAKDGASRSPPHCLS